MDKCTFCKATEIELISTKRDIIALRAQVEALTDQRFWWKELANSIHMGDNWAASGAYDVLVKMGEISIDISTILDDELEKAMKGLRDEI